MTWGKFLEVSVPQLPPQHKGDKGSIPTAPHKLSLILTCIFHPRRCIVYIKTHPPLILIEIFLTLWQLKEEGSVPRPPHSGRFGSFNWSASLSSSGGGAGV